MLKGTVHRDIRAAYPEPVEPAAVREKLLELLGIEVPTKADFVVDSVNDEHGLRVSRGVLP